MAILEKIPADLLKCLSENNIVLPDDITNIEGLLVHSIQKLDEEFCLKVLKHVENVENIYVNDYPMLKKILIAENKISDMPDEQFYATVETIFDLEKYQCKTDLSLAMLAIKREFPRLAYQILVRFPEIKMYFNLRNTYDMAKNHEYDNICRLFHPLLIRLVHCDRYTENFAKQIEFIFIHIVYVFYEKTNIEVTNLDDKLEKLTHHLEKLVDLPELVEMYDDQSHLAELSDEKASRYILTHRVKFTPEFMSNFVDISEDPLRPYYMPRALFDIMPELKGHEKLISEF
jgi:hypothetical protein